MIASLIAVAVAVSAPPEANEATKFIRSVLAPCGFGGADVAPDALYEPDLAHLVKRREDLETSDVVTPGESLDGDLRGCGRSPESPVSAVKLGTRSGDALTVIVDTGTAKMNNLERVTLLLVQTSNGPRVWDASTKYHKSLRKILQDEVAAGEKWQTQVRAAMSFVQRTAGAASVKAGFGQRGRVLIHATLADGTQQHFIIDASGQTPQVWDSFKNDIEGSRRVALADQATMRDAMPLTDDEAVAFVRRELERFITPIKGHKEPIAAGLVELMAVDGQLTDGVPYINGDIVCGCQDYDKFSIQSVKAAGHDGVMVRVEADFRIFNDAKSARHEVFIVVKTTSGVMIYDVVEVDQGSLRAQLKKVVADDYAAAADPASAGLHRDDQPPVR